LRRETKMRQKNQISIRVSDEIRERASKLLAKMNKDPLLRGASLRDATVLRMAIHEGLEALEKRFS
jgi:predicted DNA-binding protein